MLSNILTFINITLMILFFHAESLNADVHFILKATQLELAIFQVLSHMWLGAAILDSPHLDPDEYSPSASLGTGAAFTLSSEHSLVLETDACLDG